jgi:hypothetical protein
MLKLSSTSNKPFTGVHGTVVSTTNNLLEKTIHVLMTNGIQKSVDVSKSAISFIEGNKVFIVIASDADRLQLVYVNNFASNEIEIAKIDATLSVWTFVAFVGILIGLYVMFKEKFMDGLYISIGSGLATWFFGWLTSSEINDANSKLKAVFNEHSFDPGDVKLTT